MLLIKKPLGRLRAILDRCAFAAWWGVFKALGCLREPCESWLPEGGRSVLVIAPHPDDEAMGCGGTLAHHLAAGDVVEVAIVTDGRRSRAGGLAPEAMARARRAEAASAAELLGVSKLRWFGFEEGEWTDGELEPALSRLIAESRPDIIYAPCRLDYHPEHRRVAECLSRVAPATVTVRVYTLDVPLNGLVNLRVDVSAEMSLLGRLFETYTTQRASLLRGLRVRRYAAALSGCGQATEEFWELSGADYRRSHPPNAPPPRVRGVRARPFSDPLSYLTGKRARKAIARLRAAE